MAIPGSPAFLMPAGDDELMRRMRDIERYMTELGPSIAASIKPAMDDIRAQQDITSGLVADLMTAQATLATTVSGLATAQATLATTVTDLASRVTQTATIATFDTGSLPNDSTFHTYGSSIPITIAVPTGKLVVTVGCGQASISPSSTGSVTAEATFSFSDGSVNLGDVYARGYAAQSINVSGASLSVQHAFTVTPGTYTITGQMRAWANGSATGSVNFAKPYLTVQVTG